MIYFADISCLRTGKGTKSEAGNRRSFDGGASIRRKPSSESAKARKQEESARVLEVDKRKMDVLRTGGNGMVMLGFVG